MQNTVLCERPCSRERLSKLRYWPGQDFGASESDPGSTPGRVAEGVAEGGVGAREVDPAQDATTSRTAISHSGPNAFLCLATTSIITLYPSSSPDPSSGLLHDHALPDDLDHAGHRFQVADSGGEIMAGIVFSYARAFPSAGSRLLDDLVCPAASRWIPWGGRLGSSARQPSQHRQCRHEIG